MDALSSSDLDDFEIPAFLQNHTDEDSHRPELLRKLEESGSTAGVTPTELLDAFSHVALSARDFNEAFTALLGLNIGRRLKKLLDAAAKDAGTEQMAWALLLDWLMGALTGWPTVTRHGRRLLRSQLAGVDEGMKLKAGERFAAALPGLGPDTWGHVSVTLKEKLALKVRSLVGSDRLSD